MINKEILIPNCFYYSQPAATSAFRLKYQHSFS